MKSCITQGWVAVVGLLMAINLGLLLQGHVGSSHAAKPIVYKVVEVLPDTQSMQAALNEHGIAGWELVAVGMGEMQAPRLIFKKVDLPQP